MPTSFPYYKQKAEAPRQLNLEELTLLRRHEQDSARGYEADAGLVDAVNVSVLLGQPLLLTGEPGTGKTQLAYSVSWQLGFEPPSPLKFETKSTSTARDLFYTYDTVGRFHAAQTGQTSRSSIDFITFNALGVALLLANEEDKVKHLLPTGFKHGKRRRSVVLIDEIDKAPRDFPNDILNEVEGMYFKIPELGNAQIDAEEKLRPVIILTSNSEKNLPEAFLRRCIYYNIPFPKEGTLKKIVENRISYFKNTPVKWLDSALKLFYELRAPNSPLVKKPATAELLGWLTALHEICVRLELSEDTDNLLALHRRPEHAAPDTPNFIETTLNTLVKNLDDRNAALTIIKKSLA